MPRRIQNFTCNTIACVGSRALSQPRVVFVISAFYQVRDQDFGPGRRRKRAPAVSETRPLLPWIEIEIINGRYVRKRNMFKVHASEAAGRS
ncbi:hypothetical protein EVAR_51393_1 [Eumeta japonica]|uniref:Uncharacterized protein n=1 Tax=Eumeta variegata TaxID=151549 RepID=A0A4C1ZRU4_EUMVA|nr:hypothetical protein EVAR_51393_1 [Eumeta japonica]